MTASDLDHLTAKEQIALKRASLRHLLDLKIHGYSPKRTELKIDVRTDKIVRQPAPSPRARRRA